MNILVLGGGSSPEREISLLSAAAVRDALTDLGHAVTYLDPRDGIQQVAQAAKENDLTFPILHGKGGEDGQIQQTLDQAGARYFGSGYEASKTCFYKPSVVALMREHGVPTAGSELVTKSSLRNSRLLSRPFVLKPPSGGSSVDTFIERRIPVELGHFADALSRYEEMMIEELVEGIEITVPVLGTRALPVIEIEPPLGQEFDYENKYNGATAELCPPKRVSAKVQLEAQQIAERVHAFTGCRHLSRTDMFVRPDGTLVALEINTMPGLTSQSLFPKAAEVSGLPWHDLVSRFVELAQS